MDEEWVVIPTLHGCGKRLLTERERCRMVSHIGMKALSASSAMRWYHFFTLTEKGAFSAHTS